MNPSATQFRVKLSPFFPCLCTFIALLFLRDFVGIAIPSILFLFLTLIIAAFADKTEILAFCFCCIPILNAFQSKYALLICICFYIFRHHKKKVNISHILPILFLFFWELLHGLSKSFPLIDVVRVFTELFFCCFILSLSKDAFDFKKIFRSMAFTAATVYMILLFSQLQEVNYQIDLLFSGVFRFGYAVDTEVMSIGIHPNYLSFICLCCIEGLSLIIYKKQHSILDIVLVIVLSILGLLTMSKKFILSVFAFLILFVFCQKNRLKTIFVFVILLIIVLLLLMYVFPTAYEAILARFEEEDLSTGRNDIFKHFTNLLLNDAKLFLFGVGLYGYENTILTNYYNIIPHNGIQELFVMWGLPGFLLFTVFAFLFFKKARKSNSNIKFVNYIPLVTMILHIMVSQMISSSVTTMLLAAIYLFLIFDVTDTSPSIPPNTKTEKISSVTSQQAENK